MKNRVLISHAGIAASILTAGTAMATTSYDLTTAPSSAVINGALFKTYDLRSAGSGVLQSFVRVSSNNGTEQGYNTSGRPVPFDENTSGTFTHDCQVSDFPLMTIGGTDYYEFILDINQTNSNPLLSLDAVKIFTSSTPSQTTTDISSLGVLRYDMDGAPGGDATVELNYSNFTGSGEADMVLYVPASLFGSTSDYLYLYSSFGVPNPNNDGYEEWAHRDAGGPPPPPPPPPPPVPLPGAAAMGLAGLSALALGRRRGAK
jgi:hypothetical protein